MKKHGLLIDMDGVIYKGGALIEGSLEFITYLQKNKIPFLFLTNNSRPTPIDIQLKLKELGIEVDAENIYTSAMATAQFLSHQKENPTAYILGEGGLLSAFYSQGIAISETNPDYVVVGEGRALTLEMIENAINFIIGGAKLIATNLDPSPKEIDWVKPGTKAVVALLEEATGMKAFSIGKPSPIMMRYARKELALQAENTIMIGDTMETDVLGGISMSYTTILVLSGSTSLDDLKKFPYSPNFVLENIGKAIDVLKKINK